MQQVLSLIKGFLVEVGGQLAPEATIEEERYHVAPAEPRPTPGEFFEIPEGPSRRMGLQLFQAGRSRTFLIGQVVTDGDVRPVHYASVASAILRRDNGRLSPFTRPLTADLVLMDLSNIDESEVVERYREGLEIIDTRPATCSYQDRRLAAIGQAARVQREMQEEGLLACNQDREPGVIIAIDGSLSQIEGAAMMPGVVGILPAEPDVLGQANTVLACPFKGRGALDLSASPASFYMRLREPWGRNPDFGLLRVELGTNPDGGPADEQWATDVASLLMKERLPVDPHSVGWDKSLFALAHAARYIDTLIPPPRVVTTYFGRSTA
jgi:hypothetical protein